VLHTEHRGQRCVVADRQVREQPRDLVGARHAGVRDAVRGQAHQLAPVEQDAARVGAVVAADDVDQRRLARAVGAEHPEDLALAHVEVDAVERADARESLAHAPDHQERAAGRRRSAVGGRSLRPCRAGRQRRRPLALYQSPQDAVGHEQHRPNEDRADDRLARDRLVGGGRRVEQDRDRRRADRGARPVARAAEHAHQHDRQRHRDVERRRRRDVLHEQRLDAAREPRERAREPERDQLVPVRRHAHHLGGVLVVVDREEAETQAPFATTYATTSVATASASAIR
jgi:hypothetical protein